MAELSIVLPVYNVDPYINDCLDSIAAQTFQDFECLLVDDGSTDLSGIICDSYSRRDDRFRVIHQENAGVSSARNAGIEAAAAPLLAFIDPDDYVSTDYFELLIQGMRRIDADIAVSSFRLVQEDGNVGEYEWSNRILQYREKDFTFEMMDNDSVVDAVCKDVFGCGCWGKLFQRELWGSTRFPTDIDLGEDSMVVPPVIVRADRAVFVPGAKYFYRQRKKSLLHGTVTAERFRKNVQASRVMLQNLTECVPGRAVDFSLLRFGYDFGCAVNFLQSNPSATRGKSTLYAILQALWKL